MNPWELVTMSLRTVRSNPLRTILTMLGVIIGVASVITLVSIGRGTSDAIAKQFESLGTNLLVVNLLGNGRATQLNYDEVMQLENSPGIKSIAPTISKNSSHVKYDRDSQTYNVIGTNDRYLDMEKLEVATGRFLAQADLDFRNHVAVVGSDVAKEFFGNTDPTGQELNIDGYVYTVIGKLKSKGSTTGGSQDSSVIVPLNTLQRDFKLGTIRTMNVEAATSDDVNRVQAILDLYLFNKFKSNTGYNIFNSSQLLSSRVSAASSLTQQLVAVAGISLLVGGIGIMNIMLVTVSERTREIGIRKSIGAKRHNILLQFLVEATVISGLGGLIGLLLGIGLALAWPLFNPNQQTSLSLDIGLYAFLFSALVGVIFGLYPANKASKLKPIDALRFD